MTALSQSAYATFARTRMDEARRAVLGHNVCAYTGVCLGCGRPGPCPTLLAARRTLAHHSQRTVNQRPHHYGDPGHRQLPMPTEDVSTPPPAEELRTACLAVQSALDRADRQITETDDPLSTAALTRWHDALTDAWTALSLVHSGIAEARRLPGSVPPSTQQRVDALAAARTDADRATVAVGRVRRQLAAAEDRLRRTSTDAPARVAADRWRTAAARLDLVAARLALGARAVDRYAAALTGATQPPPHPATRRTSRPTTTPAATAGTIAASAGTIAANAETIAAGAWAAGAVLLRVHPWAGWRGLLARVRQHSQLDRGRSLLC
ncbi:hypothetical protein O7626_22615 [Micromonospora sp. WMMD1102]|uniref:hypothetical protein n=1 Tax=Micromonospora sp. WMMD1102 TaxID=3016105 RepID=UPI0024150354|nr:hypothetical protein [Micromonospora sp. WMMD1102]MDG4788683.1 hypothetical protein [Micromonospora sp. WMMD1102]